MKIIEVKNPDKEKWNNFVLANKGEFLQSWEWGEFQESAGNRIWRLAAIDEGGEFLAAALIIKQALLFGKNYLYCPRAPVGQITNYNPPAGGQITNKTQNLNSKIQELIFDKIKEIAEKNDSVFLKWELAVNNNVIASPEYLGRGNSATSASNSDFLLGNPVSKSANLQPHDSLILDLDKAEEELLAEMKQKTRYNIRLAEKHGVKIRISNKETFESDFEKFWLLTEETTSRDKFQSHNKDYYFKMLALRSLNEGGLEILSRKTTAKLFLAEYEGKILAANIMIFFGARATYLHGASGAAYRNLMAPYLLQWEQIKKAKKLGFKEYDFWGIVSQTTNYKPQTTNWSGITRFKTGFGGREINYPEAIDIIYQPMVYKMIKIAKKVKAVLK